MANKVKTLFLAFVFLSLLAMERTLIAQTPSQSEVVLALNRLDKGTPVSLIYNARVQAYIDVYTLQRRDHLSTIIGRAEIYFPLFEEYLDKYNLPMELKYIAVVESALDPKAQSSSGAKGLWQFLYQASRLFNLKVDSYVDERCDPVKSTDAACRYLKYLYGNFKDWNLVLAAYNGGIAQVHNAIEKSGGSTDFWTISEFLPKETQGYVPAFIAVNYVMNYYMHFGIAPAKAPFNFDDLGFVFLEKSISFNQLASFLKISEETIGEMNPLYTKEFIPVSNEPVQIVIPRDKVMDYLKQRTLLEEEKYPPTTLLPYGFKEGYERIVHKVLPGEFFHKIAMKYRVRVEDVQLWNDMKTRDLNAGQFLVIWKRPAGQVPFTLKRMLNHKSDEDYIN